jgi:hypothetical protein
MTKGWDRTGHVRSLSKKSGAGNLMSTVRLKGVTAQAGEPELFTPISDLQYGEMRYAATHDGVDTAAFF